MFSAPKISHDIQKSHHEDIKKYVMKYGLSQKTVENNWV